MINTQSSEYLKFKDIILKKYGFELKPKNNAQIAALIEQRLELNNFISIHDYINWINSDEDNPEWLILIDLITIKETYFFRNTHQFDYLSETILTNFMKQRVHLNFGNGSLPKIRILSAGCSTGEEPYSIAIAIIEKIKYTKGWDIIIDAVDISNSSLIKAKLGRYFPTDRMKTSLTEYNPVFFKKYFELCEDGSYLIKNEIRDLVRFKHLNIKNFFELPSVFLPKYDVIFCRNVLIYFDFDNQQSLVRTLENMLEPGGYLMMGDAETLHLYSHHLIMDPSNPGLIYFKPHKSEENE